MYSRKTLLAKILDTLNMIPNAKTPARKLAGSNRYSDTYAICTAIEQTKDLLDRREHDLHENIAHIAANLFPKFYERHTDTLSGFPGVINFAIDAAKVFSQAEIDFATKGDKPENSFEYLDAIESFYSYLIDSPTLPTVDQMRLEAKKAIETAKN